MNLRMRKRVDQPMAATAPAPKVDASWPFDLETCLQSASVFPRPDGDGLRAVIQLGGAGWLHDRETTRQAIEKRWPDLSPAALARAVRYLDARVRQACEPPEAKRSNWCRNW